MTPSKPVFPKRAEYGSARHGFHVRSGHLGGGGLGAVVAEYEEKYGWRMNPDDAGMPFYTVAAHTVVDWRAQDPRGSGARWRLTPGRAVP